MYRDFIEYHEGWRFVDIGIEKVCHLQWYCSDENLASSRTNRLISIFFDLGQECLYVAFLLDHIAHIVIGATCLLYLLHL
jgi:hypothetical protein